MKKKISYKELTDALNTVERACYELSDAGQITDETQIDFRILEADLLFAYKADEFLN